VAESGLDIFIKGKKANKFNRWKSSDGRGHTGYLFKELLRSNGNFQEAFHLKLVEVYLALIFCLFSIIFHSKEHLLPVLIPSIFNCVFPSITLVATETTEMPPTTAKLFWCGSRAPRREISPGNTRSSSPSTQAWKMGELYRTHNLLDLESKQSVSPELLPCCSCFSSSTKAMNHITPDVMPKNIFYLDLNNVNILIKVDNG